MTTSYISRLAKLIDGAASANEAAFETVSARLAETLANKGLVHLYGSGHSVLPVPGGVSALRLLCRLQSADRPACDVAQRARRSGGVRELLWLERTENYADKFLDHQPLNAWRHHHHLSAIAARNASGIDTALYAKKPAGCSVDRHHQPRTMPDKPATPFLRQAPGRMPPTS
jgi:uncharacterized phosphosugar-binding protein